MRVSSNPNSRFDMRGTGPLQFHVFRFSCYRNSQNGGTPVIKVKARSKHACRILQNDSSSSNDTSLSTGSKGLILCATSRFCSVNFSWCPSIEFVLILLPATSRLFVAIAVYVLSGLLVNKCIRGRTGAAVVPHVEFWEDLPGLVKARSMHSN